MPTFELEVDGALLAKAEAYAAARKTTLDRLLTDYLASIAAETLLIDLPPEASQRCITMLRHGDRDLAVRYLAQGRWHDYEAPLPAYLFAWAHLMPGLIVDAGAGTGYYSLLAACASGENEVYAFEPDAPVRRLLQANVEATGLSGRIKVSGAGLSRVTGRGALHVPSQDHGVIETSSSLESGFKGSYSQVLEVEVTTLDDALEASGTERPVQTIKVHASGHEAAVLQGAERTVAKHRPVLFIEVLKRAEPGPFSTFCALNGYMDVPLRPNGVTLAAQGVVSFVSDAWNHALVPAEALPRFLNAARYLA